VFDLPENAASISLGEQFWKEGKPVGAICHGPAALVNMKDPEGKNIVSGRKVTCFSNEEEEQVGATDKIPFLVETKLKEVRTSRFLLTISVGRKI
jgi:putative intracellular protease/amidase